MSTDAPERPAASLLRAVVAEEVRALLGRRNISKIELARRIGRSHTYVGRRLSGETAFDVDDIEMMARVLGVSVETLMRRSGGGETATTGYPPVDPLATRVLARRTPTEAQKRSSSVRQGNGRRAVRTDRRTRESQRRPVTPLAA